MLATELIMTGNATIEDLMDLAKIGYEFPCEDRAVSQIVSPAEVRARG